MIPMASVLRSYNASLLRRPLLTQCLTAGFLFGAGDLIAQQAIEKKGDKHDFARTLRLTFYGGCLFGPAMTKWYQWLGKLSFTSSKTTLVSRVGLDQLVLTPGAVGFFFTSMAFLEGRGIGEAKQRLEKAYTSTLIRNWGVFVPTQIINFAIVPAHLRFLVVSVVSLFWNTYLSFANARSQH